MKIAIIDLDGIICDDSARLAEADASGYPSKGEGSDNYWRIVLNPARVAADPLIEGAAEALTTLENDGWRIIYLTGRLADEQLSITTEWLQRHGLLDHTRRDLILKPGALRYMKATTWKAHMAKLILKACWREGDRLLIVEDNSDNLTAMLTKCQFSWHKISATNSLKTALSLFQPLTNSLQH